MLSTTQMYVRCDMKAKAIKVSSQDQLNRLLDAVALVLARRQMKLYWR